MRIKIVGLTALVCVLGSVISSTAFGAAEFTQGVGVKISSGHNSFKLVAGAKIITCTETKAEGEIHTATEATLKWTLHGCSGASCPATIEFTLVGNPGESAQSKTGDGILIKPKTGAIWAELKCGESIIKVEGTAAAELTPVKTESTAGDYIFSEASGGGKQAITEITVSGKSEKPSLKAGGESAYIEATIETTYTKAVETSGGAYEPSKEETAGPANPSQLNQPTCSCGKPVNNASGNETDQQTDLKIAGRGPGLNVARAYNAQAAANATEAGTFGYGWNGPYSAHLVVDEKAGTATVTQNDGAAVVFHSSGGKYVPGAWIESTLAKEGTGYLFTLPDQTKLEFNSEGRLTKETERNGNSITIAYNAEKHIETVTDGAGRKLTFKYNGEGQVESIKDPIGHLVEYKYTSKDLSSVTIAKKVRWEFEYNASHELTKLTDGRKDATTLEYDTSQRVIKEVIAGHERKWGYGSTPGTETSVTEPNGAKTVEHFNGDGEPTKVTHASGTEVETTTENEYNSSYELVKLTDPNKHATEYGYDASGNRTSEKDPSGDERKWKYDANHNVETETTPEGETTTFKRNEHGEPETIERPVGAETQKTEYKYNEKGDLVEAIDALKHVTKYSYDAAGDKEIETDPEKNERKWKYNEDSQITEETSPRGFTTKTERDERGLPTKVTDPLTHITEYSYDANGNVISQTDANKHTTKFEYNEENLPSKVEEPNKTIVETGYDSEGEMTSHTDGNKHTWEYKRNQLEQITEEKNPLGKVTKKKYEKAGHLESVEDPEKHTTEYKYDESSRRKAVKYSTGSPSEVTYEYNKDSKVTKMKDATGTTENTWDKLDRLTQYKNGAGKVIKYEYDRLNSPIKITYPNEKAITREYDKDERLAKVTDWNSRSETFGYSADSQLASITYPAESKYEDKYTYNEADQMTELKLTRGAETTGSQVYTRDSDGQLKKTTNMGFAGAATMEYTYDENNRLTEAGGLAYEYDKGNNPTKLEGKGAYSYNAGDELEKGPEATYAYNEDGRRTETKPTKGPATTYGYDQAGNLTSVKRPEEGEVAKIEDSYAYDGNNLRQSQTINGATAHLTWDTAREGVPLTLSDESYFYIYGPENLAIEQITSGGASQWMHHDQQGSTRMIMNLKGEVEAGYAFNAYGSLNASKGPNNSLLRYDDEYTSTDNGLIYLRARTYDPQTGQFLSVDPALSSTNEPYAYTRENPVNHVDPSGERGPGVRIPRGAAAPGAPTFGDTYSSWFSPPWGGVAYSQGYSTASTTYSSSGYIGPVGLIVPQYGWAWSPWGWVPVGPWVYQQVGFYSLYYDGPQGTLISSGCNLSGLAFGSTVTLPP